jgi:hypothetical protein
MDDKNSKFYVNILTKISDQQQEMTSCVKDLDKKLELHIQKTEFELKAINELDTQQNAILSEHVRRSNAIEESCKLRKEELEQRVEVLEQGPKLLKLFIKVCSGLAVVAGAFYGIGHLFGFF